MPQKKFWKLALNCPEQPRNLIYLKNDHRAAHHDPHLNICNIFRTKLWWYNSRIQITRTFPQIHRYIRCTFLLLLWGYERHSLNVLSEWYPCEYDDALFWNDNVENFEVVKRGVLRANAWFFNDHRRCSGAWVALVHVGVCCRDLPVAVRSHRWAALRGDVWPRSRLPLQSCFVGASSRRGRKCLNATCPSSSWPGLCLIKKKADFSQNSLVDHLSEIYVRSPDFSLNSSSFHSFNNRIIQLFMWWPAARVS